MGGVDTIPPVKLLLLLALVQQDDWATFKKLSTDKEIYNRVKAIETIAKYKNLQMAEALVPMLGDKVPGVGYEAIKTLGSLNDAEAIKFLLGDPLKKHKAAILEALGLIKDPIALDALIDALKDQSADVVVTAIWALSRIGDAKAIEPVEKLWDKKDWKIRCAVLEALRDLSPKVAGTRFDESVKDKAYQLRMTAAWVAPIVLADSAGTALKELANDNDWRVRVAAIEGCLDLRSRECVGMIVERFAKEDGRLRVDCLNALTELTGKNLGLDPKAWADWWAAAKDKFEAQPKPDKRKREAPKAGSGTASFFDVPIVSTRLAFILDLSGSMKDEYVDESGKKTGKTKLAVAQAEMNKTIAAFPDDTQFNIFLLGCADDGTWDVNTKRWKKGLSRASKKEKGDATGFVNKQEAKGWTNIWDALMLAFEDPAVDTIYLLSDGGASRGAYTRVDGILDRMAKANKYRKINVHTIHFDFPDPKTGKISSGHTWLMRDLADVTGGTYTEKFGGK